MLLLFYFIEQNKEMWHPYFATCALPIILHMILPLILDTIIDLILRLTLPSILP